MSLAYPSQNLSLKGQKVVLRKTTPKPQQQGKRLILILCRVVVILIPNTLHASLPKTLGMSYEARIHHFWGKGIDRAHTSCIHCRDTDETCGERKCVAKSQLHFRFISLVVGLKCFSWHPQCLTTTDLDYFLCTINCAFVREYRALTAEVTVTA